MRYNETPSLSVCAFGAGAVHAAILALVLPVMITLPAPDDKAQGTVAIQVVVRSEPPPMLQPAMADAAVMPLPAFMGEGDIDQAGVPVTPHDVLPQEEITGALPEAPKDPDVLPAYAAVSRAVLPVQAPEATGLAPPPLVESIPAPDAGADLSGETIASIEAREAPAALESPALEAPVPAPLRKPAFAGTESSDPENAEEPERTRVRSPPTSRRVAAPQRSRALRSPQAKRIYKGLLGGRQATTMPEYPFADR